MTTISIDLRMMNASGIGTYLRNLVPRVIAALPTCKFNLLCNVEEMNQYTWAYGKNINLINIKSHIYSVREQFELYRKTPKDTTLFWSPHYNIPLMYRGKMLVTVHDVFHLAMTRFVGGLHRQIYAKTMFSAVNHKADAILCVSRFTSNEFVRLTGPTDKIRVVYNGVNNFWFDSLKDQNPHHTPFILYVGNVKPHKNLVSLIKGYDLIKDKIPHSLIIVGKKEGFITGDTNVANSAALLGDRVQFTGFVKDAILKQYFVHAEALVFPSLYEGFGLPPLEAMASGCPTIVSKSASIPEICGDATLYFDPYCPHDIADKIQRLLNDAALKETLRHRGLKRAKQFTWEKCAEETVLMIREVLSQ